MSSVVVALAAITSLAVAACGDDIDTAGAPPPPARPRTSSVAPPAARVASISFFEPAAPVSRHDLVLRDSGIDGALRDAHLPALLLDDLDAAFVGRVDLFARATAYAELSIWLRREELIAARLTRKGETIFAALYDGDGAPPGFYDANGMAMRGVLRARPVSLRRITSRFGARFDAFTGKAATHQGVDYGVPIGTPVVSVGRGRVAAIGSSKRAGNFVKVTHADGYESFYLHLDAVDDALRIGSVVDQGEQIAVSGNTGRSTGPHLHYELHLAGIPVDPLALLPMPKVALGPLARREHLAFMKNLEAIRDRRTADEQDEQKHEQR